MPVETLPLGLWEGALFNDVNAFLVLMIILAGVLGMFSGYASIGALSALMVFLRIAVETDLWIFNSLLYVILTVVFVVGGMQIWGYAAPEGQAGDPS